MVTYYLANKHKLYQIVEPPKVNGNVVNINDLQHFVVG